MERKKGKKRILFFAITVMLLAVLFGSFVAAKYFFTGESVWGQIFAENFYFNVDILGDTTMVELSEGVEKFTAESTSGTWQLYGGNEHVITIKVQNYFDSQRITDSTIQYHASISVSDTDYQPNTALTVSPVNGTLTGGTANDTELTLTIPSWDDCSYADGTVVTLTVSSLKPYKKDITLNFVLKLSGVGVSYKIVDSKASPYAELIVMSWVENPVGTTLNPIYITWPDKLLIDNTNPYTYTIDASGVVTQMPITNTDGCCTMQMSKALKSGQSESIFFFKQNASNNYSCPVTAVPRGGTDNSYTIDLYTALKSLG